MVGVLKKIFGKKQEKDTEEKMSSEPMEIPRPAQPMNMKDETLEQENIILSEKVQELETQIKTISEQEVLKSEGIYRYYQLNQMMLLNENIKKIGQSLNKIGQLLEELK